MRRSILTAAVAGVLALSVGTSMAAVQPLQNAPTSQPSHHGQAMDRLKAALQQLNLTKTQQAQIRSIFEQTHTKLRALRSTADSTDRKTQARAIAQQARKDILQVLDPAQRAKLKSILETERSKSSNA